ncbi:MAG: ABC transporter permease [Gemmatimonadota bacterium]
MTSDPDTERTAAGAGLALRSPARLRLARATRWWRGLAGVVIIVLVAEALGRAGLISPAVLPLTSTVLARAARLAADPRFLADLASTLAAWALGMAITVAVAVPCGLLLGSVPIVRTATRALVDFLRPIPSVALILLVELLIGPGLRMNVILIGYAAVWPVLFNTIYGLDDADPVAKETLRAFGFGRLAVLRFASLPGAAPFIATGIRLASAVAIILNISTGFLTGRISGSGLGAFIAEANTGAGNTTLVLAAALWAGALGLALNGLLLWAERRLLPWHHAYLGEAS